MVEQGKVEDIFSNPKHEITRSFINSLINRNVPEVIRDRMSPTPLERTKHVVLRLIFSGQIAEEPIVSQLMKESPYSLNILAGYLDQIGQSSFGNLVVTLPHEEEALRYTRDFLSQREVKLEILGYIEEL